MTTWTKSAFALKDISACTSRIQIVRRLKMPSRHCPRQNGVAIVGQCGLSLSLSFCHDFFFLYLYLCLFVKMFFPFLYLCLFVKMFLSFFSIFVSLSWCFLLLNLFSLSRWRGGWRNGDGCGKNEQRSVLSGWPKDQKTQLRRVWSLAFCMLSFVALLWSSNMGTWCFKWKKN